jgi:hypothetical protein
MVDKSSARTDWWIPARGDLRIYAWQPEELNRVGFRLYERFRPDVPEGAQGWGAKGELRVERIVGGAAKSERADDER